eukprot:gene2838-17739_t
MAQKAAESVKRRMDSETERLLAKLIMDGALQLEENASNQGVLAFNKKPLKRAKLNDRFLQNTLKGVFSTNKRAQQAEMWELRDLQKAREEQERVDRSRRQRRSPYRGRSRSRTRSRSRSRSPRSAGRSRSRSYSRSRSPRPRASPPSSVLGSDAEQPSRASASTSSSSSGSGRSTSPRASEPTRDGVAESSHAAGGRRPSGRSRSGRSPVISSIERNKKVGGEQRKGADRDGEEGQRTGMKRKGAREEDKKEASEEDREEEEEEGWIMTDEELQAMLSKHRTRGRGGVGSRTDEPGPFLPDGASAGPSSFDPLAGVVRGPVRPPGTLGTPQRALLPMDPATILNLNPRLREMLEKVVEGKGSDRKSKKKSKKEKKSKYKKEKKSKHAKKDKSSKKRKPEKS